MGLHLSQKGLGIHLIYLLLFSIRLPGDDGLFDVHIQRRCIPAAHHGSAQAHAFDQCRLHRRLGLVSNSHNPTLSYAADEKGSTDC